MQGFLRIGIAIRNHPSPMQKRFTTWTPLVPEGTVTSSKEREREREERERRKERERGREKDRERERERETERENDGPKERERERERGEKDREGEKPTDRPTNEAAAPRAGLSLDWNSKSEATHDQCVCVRERREGGERGTGEATGLRVSPPRNINSGE